MIASLLRNLAILLGVLVGLHRVVIGAVIGSFRVLPAGHVVKLGGLTPLVIALTTDAVGVRGVWVNGRQVADADGLLADAPLAGALLTEFVR